MLEKTTIVLHRFLNIENDVKKKIPVTTLQIQPLLETKI